MSTITAVLCDDEPTRLAQAERMLNDYAQRVGADLNLLSFPDGATMLATCSQAPDVLFCDIELSPDKNGIDLVQEVKRAWPSCQVVYVTNMFAAVLMFSVPLLQRVREARKREQMVRACADTQSPPSLCKPRARAQSGGRCIVLAVSEAVAL